MPPVWNITKKSRKQKERKMISLTRLNDSKFTLNSDLIETIEEVPDTSITLTTGKKIMVKETRLEVIELVKKYKRDIFLQNNL